MPLLLPFRRAPTEEKAILALAYPFAVALAGFVAAPLLLLYLSAFGDVSDWWVGQSLPVSLKRYLGPDPFYTRYLMQRYDSWTGGIVSHYYPERWAPALKMGDAIVKPVEMPPGAWKQTAADARECLMKAMPWTHKQPLHLSWSWLAGAETVLGFTGRLGSDWRAHLRRRYATLDALNQALESEFRTFAHANYPDAPNIGSEREWPLGSPIVREYRTYLTESVDPGLLGAQSGDLAWESWLKTLPEVGGDLVNLNRLHHADWKAWDDVPLPEEPPADAAARAHWDLFLRKTASPYLIALANPDGVIPAYHKFLASRYGTLDGAASAYGMPGPPGRPPATLHGAEDHPKQYADWIEFVRTLPTDALRANSPETVWRRFLKDKYSAAAAAGEAHGVAYPDLAAIPWPQPALDRLTWDEHTVALMVEGLCSNFRRAWILMAEATPALANTAMYTLLFLVLALATNTGLAWCLSRFKFPPLQMTLAYFLALAAFPIEAMAIPNFLLLREIGLMNTIWALVLPTVVNGYYIYLLKSSFDSVPAAYYEEALLSGAGEWRLFFQVGLPMIRPMLGVVALYAFLLAYSNFLWAMIVGQSRDMWTLPVLVFSSRSMWTPPSLIAAMLAMLTVPPLIVFLAANRTLQRSLTLSKW